MFPTLPVSHVPVRLAITATIPVGVSKPTQITVTCDPPSDRYAVVWYQDTMTDIFTPEEACEAVFVMMDAALRQLATGAFLESEEAVPVVPSEDRCGVLPGQLSWDSV